MKEVLDFYNLKEDPFSITPDPEYFYPTRIHEMAVESMEYLLKKGESFLLLTGFPGTGKTTVIKTFLSKVQRVCTIPLYNPTVRPEELISYLCQKLGLGKFEGKLQGLERLREFLLESYKKGERFLLIIDEAQDMSDETLTEIKHLSNLETDKGKLLPIILVGQPSLESRLKEPKNLQLDQRISLRIKLLPLTKDEAHDFILHRIRKAGNSSLLFEKGAIKLIWKASRGIPRLINLICSRALMVGFFYNSQRIKKKYVKIALKHLNL